MQDRVYAYIEHEGQVAVFTQPRSPHAGMHVPGGGVEPGESLEHAAVRETLEETGLRCVVVGYIGSTLRQGWFPEAGAVDIERHFFHLRPIVGVEETWTWFERDASDGSGPIEFHFRWLPIRAAADRLDHGFGELLGELDESVAEAAAAEARASRVVSEGYDRLHDAYVAWSNSPGEGIRHQLIDATIGRGAAGRALDLGCGTGELATDHLHRRGFDVLGVDISPSSVARARECQPECEFIVADITRLHLPQGHFGLVTAFYSVIHVPRRRQGALFREVAFWLAPGGLFVLNVEPEGGSGESWTDTWLDGVPMFWSAWHGDETRQLLEAAGMTVVDSGLDGQAPERFLWLMAQKPR